VSTMNLLTNTEFRGLAADLMAHMLVKQIKQDERDQIWADFVSLVAPTEKKYNTAMKGYFREQRDAVLERMPEPIVWNTSYLPAVQKDMVENWLFPTEEWIEPLVTLGGLYSEEAIVITGQNALDNLALGMMFNVQNPEVEVAIAERNLRLARVVNDESLEKLRETLRVGIMDGESIPKLRNRVSALYGDFGRSRAEMIARTETSWAANEGVERSWMQSKVVEGKEFLTATDERVCVFCDSMNGTTAGLGETFFDLGDSLTVDSNAGNPITYKFDFEQIDHPPIHPRCRCALIPIVIQI